MPLTKATQNVVEGIVSTGSTGVSAGSFQVGQQYKITSLGTTTQSQWNTIAGTTGQTYVVGSLFTAATDGASSGTGAAAVARTLQNRFADVVNVKDFGAVGDGVTDDTAAILNAISYSRLNATNNDVYRPNVFFPAGDYCVQELSFNSYRGMKFIGEGTIDGVKRRTRLKFIGSNGSDSFIKIISCQHLEFEGITFYINSKESIGSLILFQANSSTSVSPLSNLSNNWIYFRDCVFFVDPSITVKPLQTIWAKSCSNVTFNRCRLMASQNVALRLGADSDVDPANGLPTLANGICTNTIITDCYFTGDIQREKSYMLDLSENQFGVLDNLAIGSKRTARMTLSGNGLVISETVRSNVWDFTGASDLTGFIIDGGSGSLSSNLIVSGNQLAGANGLVRVNKGSAIIQGNRGIANASVSFNKFVRIESTADDVYVFGNNNQDYCSVNTIGSLNASMIEDVRSSKWLPILVSKSISSDYTFTASNTWVPLISTNHKFTGGYVKISYSISVLHNDVGNLRTYGSRVRINGTTITELTRRISLQEAEYGILSVSHIVYVPESDQSVTIDVQAQQVTGAVFGTIQGNSLSQSTFTVEILNT